MLVSKKTESVYEITFDASEIKQLSDILAVYDTSPERVIDRSLQESLRIGSAGVEGIVDKVHALVSKEE